MEPCFPLQPIQLFLVIHCLKQEAFQNQYLMHIKQEEKIKNGICTSTKRPDTGQNKISIQFNKTSADFFQSGGGSGSSIIFSAQKKNRFRDCCNPYGDSYVTVLSGSHV